MLTVFIYSLPLRDPWPAPAESIDEDRRFAFERQNCEGTFVRSAKRLPPDKISSRPSIPSAGSRLATDLFVDRPRDLSRPRFSWAV
jgi:hypothetical protein